MGMGIKCMGVGIKTWEWRHLGVGIKEKVVLT